MKRPILITALCCISLLTQAAVQRNIAEETDDIAEVNAPGETMTVEGRTWWYEVPVIASGYRYERTEIGLSISGTKEIDGKTWYKIVLRQGANFDTDDKLCPFTEDAPLALIRQEDNQVFVMADKTCNPYIDCLIKSPNGFPVYETPTLVYGFGDIGDTFTMYGDNLFPVKYKIVEKTEKTETEPALYTCEFLREDITDKLYFTIGEGLGLTSLGDAKVDGISEIFFAPFGAYRPVLDIYDVPHLRYVTDGENNTVIFTAKGGYRLWENYSGVDNVTVNGENGVVDAPVYYNMQGQPVSETQPGNLYIRKAGGRTTKVIAK